MSDAPLIYLFHEKYQTGADKNVVGMQVYGDGLLRFKTAGFAASSGTRRTGLDRRDRGEADSAMTGFVLRRVGAALIVLFLASILVFAGVRALPGDPVLALAGEQRDPAVLQQIRHKYGFDQPVPVQYVK